MTYPAPNATRGRLTWSKISQDEGNWCLNLPPYYADVFTEQAPAIMSKSNTGWRESKSGITRYAYFIGLSEEDLAEIERFRDDYKQYPILGINEHLEPYFNTELDCCLALDFNFDHPGGTRTQVGEYERLAKHKKNTQAINYLIEGMTSALSRIPGLPSSSTPRCVTFVPPRNSNPTEFYLPMIIAEGVVFSLDNAIFHNDNPIVISWCKESREPMKGLPLSQKLKAWSDIIARKSINISASVQGNSVVIIDDKYQSGASMWSMAKYLKESEGATQVFGLVCVKTLRDTDNK